MIMFFSSQLLIPRLQLACSSALSAWICLVNRQWKRLLYSSDKNIVLILKNGTADLVKGAFLLCHAIRKPLVAGQFHTSVFSSRSGPLYTNSVTLTFIAWWMTAPDRDTTSFLLYPFISFRQFLVESFGEALLISYFLL